ncbi:hypothetical protein MNB_SV-3-1328 [hydrothermal vent metagenome]|uniref:Uncharacterized protein n=1 Tax=hydrothermal vent metagenome TaxID=652676 RepID=A0A1W1CRU7_9ZZZZ
MLSTKGETKDKVSGFKSGADDYLPILAPRLTEKTIKRDIEQLKIENRVERIGSTGKKVIGK